MAKKKYLELMASVADFGKEAGLNTDKLYKGNYTPVEGDNHVISVSHKIQVDNSEILYSCMDEYNPEFDRRLKFPFIGGSEKQIERYKAMAIEKDAEYFTKKSVAFDGFVQPSPEFLAMGPVAQVEYAIHEAFHKTSKLFFGQKQHSLPPEHEEASALVVGYLGSIHYFKDSGLEQEAVDHWGKNFMLAKKVNQFSRELEETLSFRCDDNKQPVSMEQKLEERQILLEKAGSEFKGELGGPVNNAFFVYWDYFYKQLEPIYNKVKESRDFKEIVQKAKTFDSWP